MLRTLPDGKSVLAVGQKSGITYGVDAEDGTIRWQHRVGQGAPSALPFSRFALVCNS